jgi:hypothetical protein
MRWFSPPSQASLSRKLSSTRRVRRLIPAVDGMEKRELLASLAANAVGITGTFAGAAWHYADNNLGGSPGWSPLNAANISSIVDSHNALGQEEEFLLPSNGGAVISYTPATGKLANTGYNFSQIVADSDGIAGIFAGNVYHYQDGALFALNGHNVTSIVDSHNSKGQETLFALTKSTEIYGFVFATGNWFDTGGQLASIMPTPRGIAGIASNGTAWNYTTGWGSMQTYTGPLTNVVQLVDSQYPDGSEETFALLGNNTVYAYKPGSTVKASEVSDFLTVNAIAPVSHGIAMITAGGQIWLNQGGGLVNTNGANAIDLVDSHGASGNEELFAQTISGKIFQYNLTGTNAGVWNYTGGFEDRSDDVGTFVPTPLETINTLAANYSGNLSDWYDNPPQEPSAGAHGYTTGIIALTGVTETSNGSGGFNVSGSLTITGTGGIFDMTESFSGTLATTSNIPTLTISSNTNDGNSFNFVFQLTPTGLYESSMTIQGLSFSISTNQNYIDSNDPTSNDSQRSVQLSPSA